VNRLEHFSRKIFPKFFSTDGEVLLDFGSGQTRLFVGGKLVLSQPSLIVLDKKSGKVLLKSKNHSLSLSNNLPDNLLGNFEIEHLVNQGVIADFDLAKSFLSSLTQLATRGKKFCLLPSGATPTEKLIALKILASLDHGKWTLVTKKDCAVTTKGCVVDIGFDLTEVIVGIGSEKMVAKTIKFGSKFFTKVIKEVIRKKYQLDISWLGAEKVKFELQGASFLSTSQGAEAPAHAKTGQKICVRGKDINAFIPKTVIVEVEVLRQPLINKVDELLDEIKLFFGQIPTDILLGSLEKGIDLWGGGGKLAGLESYFSEKLQTNVTKSEASYEKCTK